MANEATEQKPAAAEIERGFILKPTALLGFLIVVICAVSLAYVGGVMSGRASAEKEYCKIAAEQAQVAAKDPQEKEADFGILLPQELEFSRVLRNDNRLPAKNGQNLKPAKPAVPVAEKAPEKKEKPAPEGEKKEEPAAPVPLPPSTVSDYVYQVAALKSEDSADALRQRLEGRGLRTYLKREGKLLLIQVKLRGDAARPKELFAILDSLRLGRPILISQKPARD